LAAVPAADLGALAIREAVKRAQIDPSEIEDVFFGNLMANEYANIARVAALGAGLPYTVPAVMMDRQCGSSLTTFGLASMMIEGVKPITVNAKEYTIKKEKVRETFSCEGTLYGQVKQIRDIDILPTFSITPPPRDLVLALRVLRYRKARRV
jgi:hypothetical protein